MATLLAAPAAAEDSVTDLAQKFGTRESVRALSLAPAGDKAVVVLASPTGGEVSTVIDFATGALTPVLRSGGKDDRLESCIFITDSRIVCDVMFTRGNGRQLDRSSRLVAVKVDGSDLRQLSAPTTSSAFYVSRYGGGLIDLEAANNANGADADMVRGGTIDRIDQKRQARWAGGRGSRP